MRATKWLLVLDLLLAAIVIAPCGGGHPQLPKDFPRLLATRPVTPDDALWQRMLASPVTQSFQAVFQQLGRLDPDAEGNAEVTYLGLENYQHLVAVLVDGNGSYRSGYIFQVTPDGEEKGMVVHVPGDSTVRYVDAGGNQVVLTVDEELVVRDVQTLSATRVYFNWDCFAACIAREASQFPRWIQFVCEAAIGGCVLHPDPLDCNLAIQCLGPLAVWCLLHNTPEICHQQGYGGSTR